MARAEFTVYGIPAPAGSKRAYVVKGRAVVTDDSKRSRPWKSDVTAAAADAMGGRPLLRGPLSLYVQFVVPRPKGHFGARGLRPSAPTRPAVKPDATKLLRAVEDACNGVVWRDDSQIVGQLVWKDYGEPACARVFVLELEPVTPADLAA